MARTRNTSGALAGVFNSETIPTGQQVAEMIDSAVALLMPRLGEVPPILAEQAQALAALRAAYMIELAFFPEQTETGMSPYNALRMEFREELKAWDEAARGLEPNSPTAVSSMRVATEYPGYATGTY
jgi:hypothetical protein